MKITKVSQLSGKEHTMELPVTMEQLKEYRNGCDSAQAIFKNLTKDQREFLMTGIMPGEIEGKPYTGTN